jgi:hypothetical protein
MVERGNAAEPCEVPSASTLMKSQHCSGYELRITMKDSDEEQRD